MRRRLRRRSVTGKRAFLALLLVAVTFSLFGDVGTVNDNADRARGFASDKYFHVHDLDAVNLMNGNLTVGVPLGPSFPLNGGGSYHVGLFYTGIAWNYTAEQHDPDPGIVIPYTAWTPSANPRPNAGLGWRVSLGRLVTRLGGPISLAPGVQPTNYACNDAYMNYESPDGA